MPHRRLVATLFALILLLAVAAPASRASGTLRNLTQLTAEADQILTGKVIQAESFWVDDIRGRHIRTYLTVERTGILKGFPGSSVAVELPGGTVGEITEWVSNSAILSQGDEVVLYLKHDRDEPVGVGDGVFLVRAGRAFGRVGTFAVAYLASATEAVSRGEALPEEPGALADQASALTSGPVITAITPPAGSAGTQTQVVITGSGFGSSAGTNGKVEFFYRKDQPKISAPIISWSDSSITAVVPTGDVGGYPASAGSGPVTVATDGGLTSNGYQFEVTFSYGAVKWPGTNPTVSYYINEAGGPTGAGAAVQRAADTWSGAGALYQMTYAGSTSATTSSQNSRNEILWGTADAGTLAVTYYSFIGSRMIECDIVFNTLYTWSTTTTPPAGQYDVETIGLHEMGHWLNLRDLYGNSDTPNDCNKVMYGYGRLGGFKRTLDSNDALGIQWIYGTGTLYTYYVDSDRDGFGVPANPLTSTSPTPPTGYAANPNDNCPNVYNPDQADADLDGIGNACETGIAADPNHSGRVDGFDLAQLGRAFGTRRGEPRFDPNVDFDFNGVIDGQDLAFIAPLFGHSAS